MTPVARAGSHPWRTPSGTRSTWRERVLRPAPDRLWRPVASRHQPADPRTCVLEPTQQTGGEESGGRGMGQFVLVQPTVPAVGRHPVVEKQVRCAPLGRVERDRRTEIRVPARETTVGEMESADVVPRAGDHEPERSRPGLEHEVIPHSDGWARVARHFQHLEIGAIDDQALLEDARPLARAVVGEADDARGSGAPGVAQREGARSRAARTRSTSGGEGSA